MPTTTKTKPFSTDKELLIAACLRERARVLLQMERAEETAPAPGSLTLADFGDLIEAERGAMNGGT